MVDMRIPTVEEVWKRLSLEAPAPSLMTSIGLVEGEVLTYVEAHGTTAIRRLIRELEWSAPLVMMAVGALVRDGLVRATPHHLEVLVEPMQRPPQTRRPLLTRTPEVWGG